jgi:hypothetical protein
VVPYFEEGKMYLCLETNVSGRYSNLRRINKITDKFMTLHNKEADFLWSLLCMSLISLTMGPQRVGHVTRIWETNNTYIHFDGNPLEKCQFEISRKK